MFQRIKNYYHLAQAMIACVWYGFPARRARVIGVTGTDGKTTTTSIIYHILKTGGKTVSMITSVGAYIGSTTYDIGFHVTTPSPFGLQRYLRRAVDAGNDYIVLETTSHALDQFRVFGIPYDVGVLTNVTHEHLDYHKTYEAYARTKFRLLTRAKTAVLNMDDPSYGLFLRTVKKQAVKTYSLSDERADYTPKSFPFSSRLLGAFNVSNCLAAVAAANAVGIPDAVIRKALASFTPPPGRQDIIYDRKFRVMIDFAHTPNAFAEILPPVRKMTKGRLIHVFGSAGRRDRTKRPEMGKASAHSADIIVLTAEDPRNETTAAIARDIAEGINGFTELHAGGALPKSGKWYTVIPDRKDAIAFAVSIARAGDTVLLTGKGHEKSINYGHGEEPWDEFAVAREGIENVIPD